MPCFLSAKNCLKGKIMIIDFQKIIKYTRWEYPYDEGNKVTACVIIKLTITKNKVIL